MIVFIAPDVWKGQEKGRKGETIVFKKSLFIFRRDLRIDDNLALLEAAKNSEIIIPCFIFDPVQVGEKNKYKSVNAVQFMTESLKDLSDCIKKRGGTLYFFYGAPEKIVKKLIHECSCDAVFVNHDYTPFSKKRDAHIQRVCEENGIAFNAYHDALLCSPEQVLKKDGSPYTIFTPFFKRASQNIVTPPKKLHTTHFYTKKISGALALKAIDTMFPIKNQKLFTHGGAKKALAILKKINQFLHYAQEKDFPGLQKTTGLSAHLKCGTVSVRQVYLAIAQTYNKNHPLIRQLYWRDFFTHIAHFFPHVFGNPFHKKYTTVSWDNDKKMFHAWCEGKTGFPIIDAGMRQLNTTGFMHNRVRMIVASFLTKDLHIDWRLGERYFATKLVDYDPAVNNGNWQWAASTGCDAQPYFRIFNPWLQQKKFDKEAVYIKKWVPELVSVSAIDIHRWPKACIQYPFVSYPSPVVDHNKEAKNSKKLFEKNK